MANKNNTRTFKIGSHEISEKDNPDEGLKFTFDGIVTEGVTNALTSKFPGFNSEVKDDGSRTVVYIKPQRRGGIGAVIKDACHDEAAIQRFIKEVEQLGQYYER